MLIFASLTAASILIFQISDVFFAVPLVLVQKRYGFNSLFVAGFFVGIVIILQTVIGSPGIDVGIETGLEGSSTSLSLMTVRMIYSLSIIGGLMCVSFFKMRTLYLIICSTVGFAVLTFILTAYYGGTELVLNFIKEQSLEYISRMFDISDSQESEIFLREFQSLIAKGVLRAYLFSYFLILSWSWYFADLIYKRWQKQAGFQFAKYYVPEMLIWPLLVSLFGVLLDSIIGIGWFGIFMWNSAFIIAFIYGLNGIGLLRYLLNRYKVSGRGRRFIVILSIAVLLLPGVNLVILIGVPVLGVSELWIRYREGENYENYS